MDIDKEEQKQIVKQAFKEWLDEKYSAFGKWTLKSLGALIFGAAVVYLVQHGLIRG